MARRISYLCAFLPWIAACQGAAAPAAPAASPASQPVLHAVDDGLVDIGGGVSLHFHCMGHGEPTVMMEAGMGGSGTVWQMVQPELAQTTRVCVYDRAGAGYSDTPPKPRAVAQIVGELHVLLGKASITGPYVLVGHSMGGLYVRLYASHFPDEVAGIVLVDSSTEDQDTRMWSLLPPSSLQDDDSREGVTRAAQRAAMAELRAANRSLGDKPLVVLTAGRQEAAPDVPSDTTAKLDRVWQELQAELPRFSTNSVQVVAPGSGHFIQFDAPKLVIAGVREIIGAIRAHRHVDAAPLRASIGPNAAPTPSPAPQPATPPRQPASVAFKTAERAAYVAIGAGDFATADPQIAAAAAAAGDDPHLYFSVARLRATRFAYAGDFERGAAAVASVIPELAQHADLSDEFWAHNVMMMLREAQGDPASALAENDQATLAAARGSWDPAERETLAYTKDRWHRAYLSRMLAEMRTGSARQALIAYANAALAEYAARVRPIGGYDESIAILEAYFSALDGHGDVALAAAKRVDAAKDDDLEDLYLVVVGLEAGGDHSGAEAVRTIMRSSKAVYVARPIMVGWLEHDQKRDAAFTPLHPK